ncbi:GMC family oxidoreductase [Ruegeria sp. Ofav3-42]|uniref:GMC family oxidoreductase n=1 Tax=Ruegeria sp. Ofav3-42 TaxID=2917759 RepID=UPI001EF458ED|nr:GMC family oxidoreductase N-terminal domain-containing protein [Ruegeria sp. Ofav3-42]MCG7519783.1 GMC family oxidoreductase N-terminal domain-containing protein [Ruegeria sp. Ofav3-42]
MMVFDYVIAGGGSAGCVLAARLAEDPDVTVCLIEAGGKGRDLFIRMPAGNGFVFGNPRFDWGYESVPQPGLNGRKIYFARGKALGGTSIVNGMIYMRGVPADYDAWRQMGLKGWGYSELLPYFRRSEGSRDRRDGYHGAAGPLKTEPAANFGALDQAFVEAAVAAGHARLDDFNGPHRTGVARNDSTVSRGTRQSSAFAYLKSPPENLTVLTGKHIARILFENTRAVGLETIGGKRYRAAREVIVCQGAFGTPHLLMLSGVGPADHLSEHGIAPVVDLPGVGQNLADHVDVSMQWASDRLDLSHARHQRLDKAAMLMARWLLNGSGPGGGAMFSTTLFHAFDDPVLPELEVYMTPMIVEENLGNGETEAAPLLQRLGRMLLVRGRKVARAGVQIDINQERPKSLGTVRLNSVNPVEYPRIDPNYFADKRDLDELVRGVKVMREVMTQPQIAKYVTGEIGPWASARTDAEIVSAIRETAYTGHHPCSTARMGGDGDPMAVLDGQLRVRGIDGLRVVDASAMPTQITGNLYATVVAMAEKAADMLLGRPALPPENPSET